jgi:signal peptidase I
VEPTGRKIFRDYGIAVIAAVVVALLIRFYLLEAYRIPTPAMRPTLEAGDTIFVLKRPLGFRREIQRGDVLVFESPAEPGRDYIKRVLGLPGDLVQIKKGHAFVNGQALALPTPHPNALCGEERVMTSQKPHTYEVCWEQPLIEDTGPDKVPEGSVFMLGDLRSQSPADLKKRRSWGMVPLPLVKGRAQWIWLSIEPQHPGVSTARFPNFRFERMFRRIE